MKSVKNVFLRKQTTSNRIYSLLHVLVHGPARFLVKFLCFENAFDPGVVVTFTQIQIAPSVKKGREHLNQDFK